VLSDNPTLIGVPFQPESSARVFFNLCRAFCSVRVAFSTVHANVSFSFVFFRFFSSMVVDFFTLFLFLLFNLCIYFLNWFLKSVRSFRLAMIDGTTN